MGTYNPREIRTRIPILNDTLSPATDAVILGALAWGLSDNLGPKSPLPIEGPTEIDRSKTNYYEALRIREEEKRYAARIFKGTRISLAVTGSVSKLKAIQKYLYNLGLEIEVVGVPSVAKEAPYNEAFLVAKDKSEAAVDLSGLSAAQTERLSQQNGYARWGSDIVAYLEDNHALNFSRNFTLEDLSDPDKLRKIIEDVSQYKEALKSAYSKKEGTTIKYDVAMTLSSQNEDGEFYRVGVGNRVEIKLRQIPPEIIDDIYHIPENYLVDKPTKKKVKRKPNQLRVTDFNVGLPVVDKDSPINQFIESVTIYSLRPFTDDSGNISLDPKCKDGETPRVLAQYYLDENTSSEDREKILQILEDMIKGGVPFDGHNLLKGKLNKCNKPGYQFIGPENNCETTKLVR